MDNLHKGIANNSSFLADLEKWGVADEKTRKAIMEELEKIKHLYQARPDADVLFKCILHKELPQSCCKATDSTCVGIVRECMKGLKRIRQSISVAVDGDEDKVDYIYKNIISLVTTSRFSKYYAGPAKKMLGYGLGGSVLALLVALGRHGFHQVASFKEIQKRHGDSIDRLKMRLVENNNQLQRMDETLRRQIESHGNAKDERDDLQDELIMGLLAFEAKARAEAHAKEGGNDAKQN